MRHLHLTSLLIALSSLLLACHPQRYEGAKVVDDYRSPAQLLVDTTRSAATALLGSLDEEQKKQVLHDIKAPLRTDWHFIPRDRQGLMLGDMTAEQKTLVHNLMQTALSNSGYLKATDIIWLETVLYEMSNQSPGRDPGKYVLQIFGDPADKAAAWGWRLEGHHLSVNLTYAPLEQTYIPVRVAATPLFFGTNPAVVQQGPLAGKRILSDAHNLALELAKSMTEAQREKMMLDEKPRDVLTGPGRERAFDRNAGVTNQEMTPEQWDMFSKLGELFLENYEATHRELLDRRWRALPVVIDENSKGIAGVADSYQYSFAWAGPIDGDEPFYYRLQYANYLIEYSCQNRNHVHCVIHDLTDPLQEDLLKHHFEQHEH